jgi:hypothetical protein
MDGRGAVDPLHIENRCPKGLAGWAGDGMTEPPTSSADLAAPRARDELLATKVSIPRTRPDRLARRPAGRGGLVPSPSPQGSVYALLADPANQADQRLSSTPFTRIS